jgi:pimeloyl-ACP methyl ester carboxylesterase
LFAAGLQAQIEFSPCYMTGSNGNGNLQAECATWLQPLNRNDPASPQIELFVARLASTAIDPARDAFTIINGGPGGSSIDMLVDFRSVVEVFSRERDIIVIDQRGTGRSTPLTCEDLTDFDVESFDPATTVKLTRQCLDQLPQDPRYFSTTVAVEDLEALRRELGYERLSLYGVSYGTRVVQQFMRQYPDSTRAAVIDGVVPPAKVLGGAVAIHSNNTLNAVLDRCKQDKECRSAFPELPAEFAQVSERLRSGAIPLELQHPVTGVQTPLDLVYGHMAAWLRFALYAPEMSALIPLIIHQAAVDNNYTPIAANALMLIQSISSSINYGMHNAVVCTEDAPFFDNATIDYAALDATYLGREMYDTLKTMCSVWPAGIRHPGMKAPLTSDIPTLVLSGQYDPITPPEWGEEAMAGLNNARHIIAHGQGHGVFSRGCIPQLVLKFIESPVPEVLDDSCTRHLAPYPFFINGMGPAP